MTISSDYLSYHGALRLKRIIEARWEAKGLFPAVRVMRDGGSTQEHPIYVVRSDLAFDTRGWPYVKRTEII